jgi:hypothetical protein
MTLLDAVRPITRTAPAGQQDATAVARRVMTRRQLGVLLVILAVLLGGALALVFGPARGLRTDIVHVSDDLDASRDGIFLQLNTARTQLGLTEQSLEIQEAGLQVAAEAEKDTTVAAQSTEQLLEETRATLTLVREVSQSLGPDLGEKIEDVVRNVEQALKIAQQTLVVAQQTLATGREGLAVAKDTLATLKRSEQIQIQILRNAQEINRKIPGAPIFPSTNSPATVAP